MTSHHRIFGIILILIILGALLYFSRGSFNLSFLKNLNFSFTPKFNIPADLAAKTNFAPAPPQYYYQAPPTPTPTTTPISPQEIPAGFTLKDLSPYFHKIKFGSVYAGYYGSYGQISLTSYTSESGPIDVTGWFVKANRGSEYVPQAVRVYDPSGLAAESDIYMGNGDILYLYGNASAISRNLRLNKCIGYVENTNHFTPSLPRSCPWIDRSAVSSFTGACQDYALSLGGCALPAANPPVPETDYACRSFLDTINYKGCFDRHRADSDFLSHEWWAWTNSQILDARHDTVLLFDKNGLLVDEYSY
jgi:hypothetical protein